MAAESDPGDAVVLANLLRTDRPTIARYPSISDEALVVKALARQHQEAFWAMHQTIIRLRCVARVGSARVEVSSELEHHAATTILAAPTPAASAKCHPTAIRNTAARPPQRRALVDHILLELDTPALRQLRLPRPRSRPTVTGLVLGDRGDAPHG